MFLTTKQLVRSYGIDMEIARFFVDREPPANNLYWHEKLLYLRPAPGYVFIPLIIDLLYGIGIEKEKLLSEEFVGVMEQVGHISALEETGKISDEAAVILCTELVKDCSNKAWLAEVNCYFTGNEKNVFHRITTPFKALHRGDLFLFSLAALSFAETLFQVVAKQWFALITTLLLLDDAEDISVDQEAGDVNAFLESGLYREGVERLSNLITGNIETIGKVNPIMAAELMRKATERFQMQDILDLLNH